ncbi:hypothetical protein T08_5813 [Trichinella sp. T8]|nr:hypothetical protein T08_5813 [Trichinella sp. T8]
MHERVRDRFALQCLGVSGDPAALGVHFSVGFRPPQAAPPVTPRLLPKIDLPSLRPKLFPPADV